MSIALRHPDSPPSSTLVVEQRDFLHSHCTLHACTVPALSTTPCHILALQLLAPFKAFASFLDRLIPVPLWVFDHERLWCSFRCGRLVTLVFYHPVHQQLAVSLSRRHVARPVCRRLNGLVFVELLVGLWNNRTPVSLNILPMALPSSLCSATSIFSSDLNEARVVQDSAVRIGRAS